MRTISRDGSCKSYPILLTLRLNLDNFLDFPELSSRSIVS